MGPRGRAGVLAVILVLVLAGAYVAVAGGFRLPGPSGPGAGTADAGGVAGGDGTLVDVAGTGDVPEVGALAPDFTAVTLDGDEVTLSEFRGRPVWLTFGATWCASCRVEAPDIQAAYEESDDTVVLAVYLSEDADDVRPYVERLGMTFTHLPDPDERLASRFHVIGVPMHYFIDREGVVRALKFGVLSRPQMDAELAAIAR